MLNYLTQHKIADLVVFQKLRYRTLEYLCMLAEEGGYKGSLGPIGIKTSRDVLMVSRLLELGVVGSDLET